MNRVKPKFKVGDRVRIKDLNKFDSSSEPQIIREMYRCSNSIGVIRSRSYTIHSPYTHIYLVSVNGCISYSYREEWLSKAKVSLGGV